MPRQTHHPQQQQSDTRHIGISCDGCGQRAFTGRRYKCLRCQDFDLCGRCFDTANFGASDGSRRAAGVGQHEASHPMQCVLSPQMLRIFHHSDDFNDVSGVGIFGGGGGGGVTGATAYTCPLCNRLGLSDTDLAEHVVSEHADDSAGPDVICPICACTPSSGPSPRIRSLVRHLLRDHAADAAAAAVASSERVGGSAAAAAAAAAASRRRHPAGGDPITELLAQLGGRAPSNLELQLRRSRMLERHSLIAGVGGAATAAALTTSAPVVEQPSSAASESSRKQQQRQSNSQRYPLLHSLASADPPAAGSSDAGSVAALETEVSKCLADQLTNGLLLLDGDCQLDEEKSSVAASLS